MISRTLIAAIALSGSAVTLAAPTTDYNMSVGYWDGSGSNVNSMASDFSGSGVTYDNQGNARESHSADISNNGGSLSVSMSFATFDGSSFYNHMLPSEATAQTWDGTTFDVGGIIVDWGNNGGGPWTGYNGLDTGGYTQVESVVINWLFADSSQDFSQDVTDTFASLTTFHDLSGTNEMYLQHGLVYGLELQNGSLMGDANAFTIDMTLVPVPEPSTFSMLAFCGIAMAGYSRLQRRRK